MSRQRLLSWAVGEELRLLQAAIEATPVEHRHIFDFCMSPYYAQDQSAKGKQRRAAALARHIERMAARTGGAR